MQFNELRLAEPVLRAVRAAGYEQATPIQAQAIPPVLEGRDLLGCAQTGTGKTAAFSLPILHRLAERRVDHRGIRALIVTPTRELAAQIGDSLKTYGRHLPLRSAVIFGGVGQRPQEQALRRGVDILVATPGRLLDLMQQGHVRLDRVEVLVLDEADRMLDMGFIHDIRAIVAKVPADRQTLFFSATMPPEIRALAGNWLSDPVEVSVTPQSTAAETVIQRVYLVEREHKQDLLAHLLGDARMQKTLVFTRTKHGADRVVKKLSRVGIRAEAIHGGKAQNARLRSLAAFKAGTVPVLIASDLAARGLDIDDITHVVNFDLPNEPETYVHRIGRTGRAGASGHAISFCASEERGFLRAIERAISASVPVDDDQPFHASFTKMPVEQHGGGRGGQQPSRRAGGNRGGQAVRSGRGGGPGGAGRTGGGRNGRGGADGRERAAEGGGRAGGEQRARRSSDQRPRRANESRPQRSGEPRAPRSGESRPQRPATAEPRGERTADTARRRTGAPSGGRSFRAASAPSRRR